MPAAAKSLILITGRFRDRKLEDAYRLDHLQWNQRTARNLIVLSQLGVIGFILMDYRFFGPSPQFLALLGARTLELLISLCVLHRLWRMPKPDEFDRLLLLWSLLLLVLIFYVNLTRPPAYVGHMLIDLIIVAVVYLVLPLPLVLQAVLALLGTLANLALVLILKPPAEDYPVGIILAANALVNLMGITTSLELQRWKRQQFLALNQEKRVREDLERALAEIKTLRGIVPICMCCKRIRDDAGFWQQVEVYVRDRTHAQFSHGICPACAEEFYRQDADPPAEP